MAAELAQLRKALAKERQMNEILKNGGLFQQSRVMRYRFIEEHKGHYGVDELCECFRLSRSGYYNWTIR